MRTSTPAGSAVGSFPNTRIDPSAARSNPRTCLMRVVLPAPLTPTSPKTVPRGTLRRTLSRATFGPNRRVRPVTSITLSGESEWMATIGSHLLGIGLQGFVARAHEFDHFLGADAETSSFSEQGVD